MCSLSDVYGNNIDCVVETRNDPFDSGFQVVRTQTIYCAFNDDIHITTPSKLSNSINENVTVIELTNNENVAYLPEDVNIPFPSLRVINAYGCSIKSVSKPNLNGLVKLVKLNLERNQIAKIDENSFDDLIALVDINLDDNKLEDLPSKLFRELPHLDTLRVKNNQLQSLDVDTFKNNKQIALLHLSDNKLTTLPAGLFDGLTIMRQLWLNGNEITGLPPHIFDDCSSLIDLDLARNKIKIIDTNWLLKLTPLREVSFSRNPLDFADLSIFDNNKNLVMFFFNGITTKDIRHIDRVDQMTKIKGIGFHDTCVNGQFHEGNLGKLKESVAENCVV